MNRFNLVIIVLIVVVISMFSYLAFSRNTYKVDKNDGVVFSVSMLKDGQEIYNTNKYVAIGDNEYGIDDNLIGKKIDDEVSIKDYKLLEDVKTSSDETTKKGTVVDLELGITDITPIK
ncbi:MAG: hypothetical protein ACK5HS_02215 [Mycoplasmatales bacterium]